MANHKSAKKRSKQNLVRRERNRSYLSGVRTAVKKFRNGLEELKAGKVQADAVETLMQKAQSALNRAATKGLLHKNNASRRVSRMALSFARASESK